MHILLSGHRTHAKNVAPDMRSVRAVPYQLPVAQGTGAAERGRGTCTASCDSARRVTQPGAGRWLCYLCLICRVSKHQNELNCYCCLQEYLRDDLRCGSAACASCSPTAPALAADASHYIIPDAPALADLLEVFELAEMAHYVLLTRRGPCPFLSSFRVAPNICMSLCARQAAFISVCVSFSGLLAAHSLALRLQRAAALARLRQCAALGAASRALPGCAPLLRAAGRPALRADRRVRARCP